MPGCQSAEVVDDRTFKVRVGIGIAAIKATINLDVTMVELRCPPTPASRRTAWLQSARSTSRV
jgi:carbon monoxide dehydrogenase subunit G